VVQSAADLLIAQGNDRINQQISTLLQDNRQAWLINDEVTRVWAIGWKADVAESMVAAEIEYKAWQRSMELEHALAEARQQRLLAARESGDAALVESLLGGYEDPDFSDYGSSYAYDANRNYSYQSIKSGSSYLDDKFNQYTANMGGGNFNSWVLSGNSNSWTLR